MEHFTLESAYQTLQVFLPVEFSDDAEHGWRWCATVEDPPTIAIARPDILLVEDDDDIRTDLALLLEELGYQVAVAANGEDALNLLHNSVRPNLIVLDLMMPVMNGWQFRFEQQQDPQLAPIPVIVLSAVNDAQQAAASLNANACLAKPFHLDALVSAIARCS